MTQKDDNFIKFNFDFRLIQNDSFKGPGLFAFDFKECDFLPAFYTYNNSKDSLERVLNSLKNSRLLLTGSYKWYDKHYGPIVIDNIQPEDFEFIDGLQLYSEIDKLVDQTKDQFYELDYRNDETSIVKHKIRRVTEFVPIDSVTFFKYNVEVKAENTGSMKVVEHNLFNYFYFIIGFNQTKFYLITLFYE